MVDHKKACDSLNQASAADMCVIAQNGTVGFKGLNRVKILTLTGLSSITVDHRWSFRGYSEWDIIVAKQALYVKFCFAYCNVIVCFKLNM